MSKRNAPDTKGNATPSALVPEGQRDTNTYADVMADPLFLLAPPRSFASVVGAMLGQHPQMYDLPETHLFGVETMAEWWDLSSQATFDMAHGLLRAVAQLYFREQTEASVKLAGGWLRRRSHFTTGYLLEVLAERVHPLILVEKSPSSAYHLTSLQRVYCMFPQAKFIHLVQHPRGYGESVMEAIKEAATHGPTPQWLLHLASFPDQPPGEHDTSQATQDLDPQRGWYALHRNICEFLRTVPDALQRRIRGEDVLRDPERHLGELVAWLGLRTDAVAIEEMKHPERSPYACFGPPGARYGNDAFFLLRPELHPVRAEMQSLDGGLNWREDGHGLLPEVRELARQFGYDSPFGHFWSPAVN